MDIGACVSSCSYESKTNAINTGVGHGLASSALLAELIFAKNKLFGNSFPIVGAAYGLLIIFVLASLLLDRGPWFAGA